MALIIYGSTASAPILMLLAYGPRTSIGVVI
jgi:hypothetical protein